MVNPLYVVLCPSSISANAPEQAIFCDHLKSNIEIWCFCNMGDVIVEQLYKESISLANEVAAGVQDKHPVKQVKFVDEVEKAKEKLIMGDKSKSRI